MSAVLLAPEPVAAEPRADAYDAFRRRRFFGSLDGLRCVSILAVIWHHAAIPLSRADGLPGRGYLGVQLFFGISGFLITTLLLRERDEMGAISLRAFYSRRALRIFPLYYLVLLLYVAVVWAGARTSADGQQFFHNLPYFATYTSNWFVPLEGRVIFAFAWSLAAEEQFYLVWPWVERAMGGGLGAVGAMLGLVGVHLAVLAGLLNGVLPAGSLPHVVLASVAMPICCGVLAAHLLHSRAGFRRAWPWLGAGWSAPLFAGLTLVLAGLRGGSMPVWLADTLLALAMVGLVAASAIREDHPLAGFFAARPARAVGRVSYGMYLLHMLCFNVVSRIFGFGRTSAPVLAFVATALAAFAVAWVSYRWFESPFLRLKARWSRQGVSA